MSGQHPLTHAGAGRFWKPADDNAFSTPTRPRALTRPLSNSVVSNFRSSTRSEALGPAPRESYIKLSLDTESAIRPRSFSNVTSQSMIDRSSSSTSGSSSASTRYSTTIGSVLSLPSEYSYSPTNQALPSIPERMSLAQRILFDERQSKTTAYVRHLERLEDLRLSQERSPNEPPKRFSSSQLTPPNSAQPGESVDGNRPRSGSGRSYGAVSDVSSGGGLKLDLGENAPFQNLFGSTPTATPEDQKRNIQTPPTSPRHPLPRRSSSSTQQSCEPQLHMEPPNHELPIDGAQDSENQMSEERLHELEPTRQRPPELDTPHTPQNPCAESPASLDQVSAREEPTLLRQIRSQSNLAVELDENTAPVLLGTVPPPQISLSYARASLRPPPRPPSVNPELPSSTSSIHQRSSSQSQPPPPPPPPYSSHDWSRWTDTTLASQQPTSPSSNLPEPVEQSVTPPAPLRQPPPVPISESSMSSPPPPLPPRPPLADHFELSSSLSVIHKPRPRSAEQHLNRTRRYSNLAAYNTVPGDPFPIFPPKKPPIATYPSFESQPTENKIGEVQHSEESLGRYLAPGEGTRSRRNSTDGKLPKVEVSIEPDIDPRTGREWFDSGVRVVR